MSDYTTHSSVKHSPESTLSLSRNTIASTIMYTILDTQLIASVLVVAKGMHPCCYLCRLLLASTPV